MKKVFLFSLVILMSCLISPVFASGGQEDRDQLEVTFVTPLVAHPVWLVAKEGFEQAGEDLGLKTNWVGPADLDINTMISLIETAIVEQVDGIVTMGLNPEAMVPVMKKAEEAGIPVVVVNSDIPDAPRLAYIGTDGTNLGSVGGEAIKKALTGEKIKALGIVASLDYKIIVDILDGYKGSLSSHQSGYEYLDTAESKSDMLTAVDRWTELFSTYPDANVALCVGGEVAPAARLVVEEMGKADDILIMGIDDMQETVDGIREGIVYGTMTQNFYRMGYQPVQWIKQYIESGERPENLINDSGTMVVTEENIETYAEDMKNPALW